MSEEPSSVYNFVNKFNEGMTPQMNALHSIKTDIHTIAEKVGTGTGSITIPEEAQCHCDQHSGDNTPTDTGVDIAVVNPGEDIPGNVNDGGMIIIYND